MCRVAFSSTMPKNSSENGCIEMNVNSVQNCNCSTSRDYVCVGIPGHRTIALISVVTRDLRKSSKWAIRGGDIREQESIIIAQRIIVLGIIASRSIIASSSIYRIKQHHCLASSIIASCIMYGVKHHGV